MSGAVLILSIPDLCLCLNFLTSGSSSFDYQFRLGGGATYNSLLLDFFLGLITPDAHRMLNSFICHNAQPLTSQSSQHMNENMFCILIGLYENLHFIPYYTH